MRFSSVRFGARRGARLAVVFGAFGLVIAPTRVTAQQVAPTGVLRPGLVTDATAGVAYVMNPAGGISAVDLATGASRWTSNAAAKPLALVGNRLVAQVEPRPPGNRLQVVTLRARARGEVASRSTTNLPAGVRVGLGEGLHGTFDLTAQPSGGDVILHWTFVATPIRGIEDARDTTARAEPAARPVVRRGALRLRVSTGALTALDTTRVAAPRQPAWILPAQAKLRDAAPQQYESADGRHVVASERVGDDRVWDNYRWTIYDRSGRRLGEVRSHVSFTPFVVRDSVAVFETTPYQRADQAAEPAKLRGYSLVNGREVWSRPVREIVYRGPYPP